MSIIKSYSIGGQRDKYIGFACETGIYDFLHDYSKELGLSVASTVRRLILIGAMCEKDHDEKSVIPFSFKVEKPIDARGSDGMGSKSSSWLDDWCAVHGLEVDEE